MATTRKKPAGAKRAAAPSPASTAGHAVTFTGADDATTRVRVDGGEFLTLGVQVLVDESAARALLAIPGMRFEVTPPLPDAQASPTTGA